MNDAQVALDAAGGLSLAGVLDFRSGSRLREEGAALIKQSAASALVIDCSAVEHSSSVGLALLLAFLRDAKVCGKTASVQGMPEGMQEIAELYGVTELFAS